MSDESKTTLTAFDIACVVVGGIIGIGIFFSPQKVAAAVDSEAQVIAAWSLGGFMVLCGAFVYARLSQIAPGDGGVFQYLRQAFGLLPAFLYGWCNLLVIQAGAQGIVGLVMVDNLQKALGCGAFTDVQKVAIASGTIGVLTVVNAVGLRFGRNVQVALTVLKTAAVFAVVAVAVFAAGGAAPVVRDAPVEPRGFLRAMSLSMLPVLFACGGFQHGSFVARVARRPLRDVPIGIVAGVVVVVVAYLSINLAYLEMLGLEDAARSKTIAVDAVAAAFGGDAVADTVARVFGAVIVVSALGVMNTISMAPPYVLHAMAQKGLFFKVAGRVHAGFGTPLPAITMQGAWAVLLLCGTQALAWAWPAIGDPLGFLLDGVVFVDWLFYGACGVALIALLLRRGFERGDRAYLVAAALFALSGLAVTVGAIWTTRTPSLAGLAVLAAGFVAYRAFRART